MEVDSMGGLIRQKPAGPAYKLLFSLGGKKIVLFVKLEVLRYFSNL